MLWPDADLGEFKMEWMYNWDNELNWLNLSIAAVTNISCIYIVTTMIYWWWRLRVSETNMRALILSLIVAKGGIFLWTATTMVQLSWFEIPQPLITLPARFFIMIACLLQIWVTTRVTPAPHIYQMVPKNGNHAEQPDND